MSTGTHLIGGELVGDGDLARALDGLEARVIAALAEPWRLAIILDAADNLARELRDGESGVSKDLRCILTSTHAQPPAEAAQTLAEVAGFLAREHLEAKLRRELGSTDPFALVRPSFKTDHFEAYAPLGVLAHIVPTNATSVGPLSAVEGLLSGNFNVVKTGGKDGTFTQHMLKALCDRDPTGAIARRLFVARVSSKDSELLGRLIALADGVAVWGSEEAVTAVRAIAPPTARFIDWGPKISFAYLAKDYFAHQETLAALAGEIVAVEQQACSSPQVIYLDTDERAAVEAFAERFHAHLQAAAERKPPPAMSMQEQAECTNVVALAKLEAPMGLTKVIAPPDASYRILVDHRSTLRASPLNRTIWVKGLPRKELVRVLRPMRAYLQTVGLAASRHDYAELSRALLDAGTLRITAVGDMLSSYAGEPHDGVYALQRYARRVSVQPSTLLGGVAAFEQIISAVAAAKPREKPAVLTKEGFQAITVADADAELYFKSGGSSGAPKLSVFTYDDYHRHMDLAARGLYAAGLDPNRDRCLNLFFAGGLYGGFVSTFSVLETMRATQFPMAAQADTLEVAKLIVERRINVLLGMPSYLIQLFQRHADLLAEHRVVEKIFFGGEHFNETQKASLKQRFGVKDIRSASYGSVDAGPLGYQCTTCTGTSYHLHSDLHALEILALEADEPAAAGEIGRLIFTSKVRRGQNIDRYEIGDVGRWLAGECASGVLAPRFELLGRHGDVFRIGSEFLNYRKISHILADHCGHAGELQILLKDDGPVEEVVVLVDQAQVATSAMRATLLKTYEELRNIVEDDGLLKLTVELVEGSALARTPGSGKLRAVIDLRQAGGKR